MKEILSVLIIGGGDRGESYHKFVEKSKIKIKIDGIADPRKEKRDWFAKENNIPPERIFNSGEEALNSGKDFDFVYIATPDKTHFPLTKLALEKGYNILLEKPLATTPKDCISLLEEQKKYNKLVDIFHVLRYTPFFQEIKRIIDSGELGRVYTIDLTEKVGHWHFAHSFVRGNSRKEIISAPSILAKSCHDLDIISWLANSKVKSVFSQGGIYHFKKENAPGNSTERCYDCPIGDCIHDARKFYLNLQGDILWPQRVISHDTSEESREKAIKEGPFGKCAFKCDNDVCDNQDVLIDFENGIKANFMLRFGGPKMTREINICLEKGELKGSISECEIKKIKYSNRKGEDKIEKIQIERGEGHSGGDPRLIENFAKAVLLNDSTISLTSLEESIPSHLIAFAAEESRKTGKLIDFKEFLNLIK